MPDELLCRKCDEWKQSFICMACHCKELKSLRKIAQAFLKWHHVPPNECRLESLDVLVEAAISWEIQEDE